jgi:hypothetical protein
MKEATYAKMVSGLVTVQAISGTHVVFLAFNMMDKL